MATLLPPKELHVEVRVIQDCGVIQTEQVRTQNIFIFFYSVYFISFFISFYFFFTKRARSISGATVSTLSDAPM